jgi:hypothetical protein
MKNETVTCAFCTLSSEPGIPWVPKRGWKDGWVGHTHGRQNTFWLGYTEKALSIDNKVVSAPYLLEKMYSLGGSVCYGE